VKKVLIGILVASLMAALFGCRQPNVDTSLTDGSSAYEFKIFGVFASPTITDVDSAFVKMMEEANGIKVNLEIPPTTNYSERLQIMLAGGDYPEVIQFVDVTNKAYIDAVQNGIIIPITDYLKTAENLNKYSYDISWDTLKTKDDSDIYAIPRTSIMRADGYVVREDWLDNVGLTLPENGEVTLDEFTEILKRFTLNDPDSDGKNNTYGFGCNQSSLGGIDPIAINVFGINGWQEDDGEFSYMHKKFDKNDNSFKNALEYMSSIYEKGFIDPDSATITRKVAQDRFMQGITGVLPAFAGNIDPVFAPTMKKINPNVKLTYITGIKDAKGKVQSAVSGTGIWGAYAITKSAKNPQKIVDSFDWMLSDEGWDAVKYGVKDVTYHEEDGKKIFNKKFEQHIIARDFVRRNNDSDFFITDRLVDDVARTTQVSAWVDQCIKNAIPSMDRGYITKASQKPEFIDYQVTMSEVITKIILGSLPVSAYDKAIDGWYKAGGLELVEEMNEYIKKVEGK